MEDILALRAAKQPLSYPSCGSVFKRPAGYYAGALIEESGLKGRRIGGAMVSPKHAGFILNVDDAKATANYNIYGVLYNWPAAMNEATSSDARPSGVQGVCPCGWHLPSDAEWTQLTDYLGTRVAGGKLKASGTTRWDPPNSGANNETGFSAFPGGYRNADGTFVSMGEDADFWSATEYSSSHAWFRNIHFNDKDVGRNNYPRQTGFAVRCVKD